MKCLILGVGGQDGSYLAEILLEQGHEVHGMYRRCSVNNLQRIEHIRDKVTLHVGDITDAGRVLCLVNSLQPDVIYNEADQDDVRCSPLAPSYQFDVTAKGVLNVLHAVERFSPNTKVFQPLSATMYAPSSDQTLASVIAPTSPYAIAKAAAYHTCVYYRDKGVRVYTGIMYNHDSPRRGPGYLLQQLCSQAVAVEQGFRDAISVHSPDAIVDVGYARDYMLAATKLVETDKPQDVIMRGSGQLSIYALIEHLEEILDTVLDIDVYAHTRPSPMRSRDACLSSLTGDMPVPIQSLLRMIVNQIRRES